MKNLLLIIVVELALAQAYGQPYVNSSRACRLAITPEDSSMLTLLLHTGQENRVAWDRRAWRHEDMLDPGRILREADWTAPRGPAPDGDEGARSTPENIRRGTTIGASTLSTRFPLGAAGC